MVTDMLSNASCCMRKNPSFKDMVIDDVSILLIALPVYIGAYYNRYDQLCIGSMLLIDMVSFHLGMLYARTHYNKEDYHNPMDDSLSSNDELSQKQIEHGATSSKCLTAEQDNIINEQLNRIVNETMDRNHMRYIYSVTQDHPINTSPVEEDIIMNEDNDEFDDLPPLIPCDMPATSEGHYLNGYINEVD